MGERYRQRHTQPAQKRQEWESNVSMREPP